MSKWSGKIGYGVTEETVPGVWKKRIIERPYHGDLLRNSRHLQQTDKSTIDNVAISNEISVVADAYAYENFWAIKYIEFMGARWTVSNVEDQRPRILMTIGGIYNGETPETSD